VRKRTKPNATTVIGYIRVSTDEQADSGLGLGAQRSTITAECKRRGWDLVAVYEDAGFSAKSLARRPGMVAALGALDRGEAAALVVAKLDRATRSTVDAAQLLERAQREGWSLVALDLGVDTTTPAGELVANVMAAVAQWERRAIGARTREALNDKRKREPAWRPGRERVVPKRVVTRITKAHRAGQGWSAIARALEADGVPTAHGGQRWYPSTVRAIYMSREAA
jgi:DNA invertase Pin-like site-specific DNA recombinase